MKLAIRRILFLAAPPALALCLGSALPSDEWPQFRGPGTIGLAVGESVPSQWSETENLKWRTKLPGPGSSSPIVVGGRVFLTCYSGYGAGSGGRAAALTRHLLCIDAASGEVLWDRRVPADWPEDPFRGYIKEHGYASNTPVSDGERVFGFFGKSGVVAFDAEGTQLWKTRVGRKSSRRRWGSAASLILHQDMVIVNAAEESRSLRALDKETGEEIWKAEGDALELCYGTPALVPVNDERTDLVIAVPDEVWGLNPETGKLRWYVETHLTGIISPSVVAGDGAIVYVFGGYKSNGSLAVRAGGNGVVTDTQVLWTSRISSYVPTPIVHEGHIWCVDHRGIFTCMKAADGKVLFRRRLEKTGSINMPFYASPILVGAKLIVPSRISGTFVLAADTRAKQLARNRFESDSSDFNATPAVADGRLYLRSNRFLYCVAAE